MGLTDSAVFFPAERKRVELAHFSITSSSRSLPSRS